MFKLGWLTEETTCRKLHQQTRERATVKGILGLAGSSLSCCLPVRQLDLPGFCSAALILIFYIFSRAEARTIICAQQTCMSIESFWGSLGFFLARKWQTWNIHFLNLFLEARKLPCLLQRKVFACL